MTNEQLLALVVNEIKRAQIGLLRGSVTVNFNKGEIAGMQTVVHHDLKNNT
jgi:hypothetical protein